MQYKCLGIPLTPRFTPSPSLKLLDFYPLRYNCINTTSSLSFSLDVYYVSTVNGGVYCPVCAGIHRELGTHPDFVTLNDDIHINNEDMQVCQNSH